MIGKPSPKKLHEAIERAITEELPFGRIDPFDFGSVQKRTYLMDLYKRSTVIREAFDLKYRDKLEKYPALKVKYLKNFEAEARKKYAKHKRSAVSDVESLNTVPAMNWEIASLENRLANDPKELVIPRPSHTSCNGHYNRFVVRK